jgi:hypothetical protein
LKHWICYSCVDMLCCHALMQHAMHSTALHPIALPHAQGPVVVAGLERYLELKQLAERQKAEADERAAKVFNLNPRAKQGATVPQPFQLAGHALLEVRGWGLPVWLAGWMQPGAGRISTPRCADTAGSAVAAAVVLFPDCPHVPTRSAASLLLAWVQAKAAERQAALLQSSLSSRLRDCTFRPQTNHQRRQEQLQRLLAQPSLGDSELAAAYY